MSAVLRSNLVETRFAAIALSLFGLSKPPLTSEPNTLVPHSAANTTNADPAASTPHRQRTTRSPHHENMGHHHAELRMLFAQVNAVNGERCSLCWPL